MLAKTAIELALMGTFGCGKDPGQVRIENRQLCDDKGASIGTEIMFMKSRGLDQSWSEFRSTRASIPKEFAPFFEALKKETPAEKDIMGAIHRGTRVCYEYFGVK